MDLHVFHGTVWVYRAVNLVITSGRRNRPGYCNRIQSGERGLRRCIDSPSWGLSTSIGRGRLSSLVTVSVWGLSRVNRPGPDMGCLAKYLAALLSLSASSVQRFFRSLIRNRCGYSAGLLSINPNFLLMLKSIFSMALWGCSFVRNFFAF